MKNNINIFIMCNFASKINLAYPQKILTGKKEILIKTILAVFKLHTCLGVYVFIYTYHFLDNFIEPSVDKFSLCAHLIVLLMWIYCAHCAFACIFASLI